MSIVRRKTAHRRVSLILSAAFVLGTTSTLFAGLYFGPMAGTFASAAWLGAICLGSARQIARLVRALDDQTRLARIDDLTGLANDRAFRETIRAPGRPPAGMTLALVDIDRFKAYNDQFGHAAGDAALAEFGRILVGLESETTRFFRLGGDEFAAIFSGASGSDPFEEAESIRRKVAGHAWSLSPITISVGMASVETVEREKLFERADRSLYRAKRAGGNRTIAQGMDGLPPG